MNDTEYTLNRVEVNLATAMALLLAVVERFGADHTAGEADSTTSCTYIVEPSRFGRLVAVCIVGQVFADLGILRALLRPGGIDQFGACGTGEGMWANAETMGVTFTEDARLLMRFAQIEQDNGRTWGHAVRRAVERMTEEVYERAIRETGLNTYDFQRAGSFALDADED